MIVSLALSGLLASAALNPLPAGQTITLQDGRTVSVADRTAPCGAPTPVTDDRFALAVTFACRDTISGVSGAGSFGVGRQAGETTPREFLMSVADEYFADAEPTIRYEQIKAVPAEISGVPVDLMCVAAEDREGTFGETTCVLAQPRTQVIINARSTGIQEAYGVMLMFLSGVLLH